MNVTSGNNAPHTQRQTAAGIQCAACLLVLISTLVPIPMFAQNRFSSLRPVSAEARRIALRAQQEIATGKVSAAREMLLEAVKTYPDEAALWNLLGAADAERNDTAMAKQAFQHAIALDPHYTGAYLNLGHLEEVESPHNPQSLSAALDTYRRLLRFDPGNVEGQFQYALVALERGLFAESLTHLRRIPKSELQRTRALAVLCADLAATGELDKARHAADAMLAHADLNEADVSPAISALASHRHIPFAILLLEGLRQRGLASPDALEELGLLEESEGKLKEARNALDAAARMKPDDVRLLMRLAEVANRQHDYRGALGYLAHARDLEPKNASVHFFFGMMCVQLDLHEEAYASLKKAVALDPDNPYYEYALGAVCTGRTDVDEAVECFKKYCQLKPRDPRGRLALGAAYYFAHNLSAAQPVLTAVVKNPVTATAANYYLGRIAADEGRYADAISYLHQAIHDRPHYADAYAALGMVFLNQKNYSASSQALRRALTLQPDNYLANLNLTMLYLRTKDSRAPAQEKRLASVRKERAERAKLFLRRIRIVR